MEDSQYLIIIALCVMFAISKIVGMKHVSALRNLSDSYKNLAAAYENKANAYEGLNTALKKQITMQENLINAYKNAPTDRRSEP
jgi:hypothetical protein